MSISIDTTALRALPPAEKLELVELLWDDLGAADAEIPLPDWIDAVARQRRDEMISGAVRGFSHDEVWRRIDGRAG